MRLQGGKEISKISYMCTFSDNLCFMSSLFRTSKHLMETSASEVPGVLKKRPKIIDSESFLELIDL